MEQVFSFIGVAYVRFPAVFLKRTQKEVCLYWQRLLGVTGRSSKGKTPASYSRVSVVLLLSLGSMHAVRGKSQ